MNAGSCITHIVQYGLQSKSSHAEHSRRLEGTGEKRKRKRAGRDKTKKKRKRNRGWERSIIAADSLLQFGLCIVSTDKKQGKDNENKKKIGKILCGWRRRIP